MEGTLDAVIFIAVCQRWEHQGEARLPKQLFCQHPVRRKILHSKIPGSEQLGEIAHSHQGPHFDDIWDRWGKFMLERERGSRAGVYGRYLNYYLRLNTS